MENNRFSAKGMGMGSSFWDASLSHLKFPQEYMDQILEWMKDPKNFLVLYGGVGTGKTYLCAALLNDYFAKTKDVRYFRCNELVSKVKAPFECSNGNYEAELSRICESKFIVLDDLGVTQNTLWQREILLTFVDKRNADGPTKATVITTNLKPSEIEAIYDKRFRSRVFSSNNLILHCDWEDRRMNLDWEKDFYKHETF